VKRLAIIGSGIAGLGCAYLLRTRYRLTLFEKNAYAGGHTNTVTVSESGRQLPIDTGFMVFNHVTYPNLVRLFSELGVVTKPTEMSFSVQHRPTGLEFSGSSINHLFAQRTNLFKPRFWRMLLQIARFNREAVAALEDPAFSKMSVGEYVRVRGYGNDFLQLYLVPMSGAVWSTPPALMLEFPAMSLLRFFHNHGFLGLNTQHPWFTVDGGAQSYVKLIQRHLGDCFHLSTPVVGVRRDGDEVIVTLADGKKEVFDQVILAAHADQSLRMLEDADVEERRLLGAFRYQPNLALLHQDASVMPRSKKCWSSWNYRIAPGPDGQSLPSTIYWMNRLQGVSKEQDYFVSINGEAFVDPRKILRRIEYEHPLFNLEALGAQAALPGLNRRGSSQSVFFAGSYFRYGFHEDAFASAVDCARAMVGGEVWA
jgi:predicted NAD/FAD-binding protein